MQEWDCFYMNIIEEATTMMRIIVQVNQEVIIDAT